MYILNKQPKTAMVQLYDRLVDKVADTCVKLYNGLPKTGKPIDNEWTVLSCLLQYDKISENLEVVSLGTGSKCIGASKMSPFGDVLNDSHAEVFARRGFLIYLYDNIEQALQSKKSIFIFENGKFTLKDNIEFIFYSSQLPCGDASIIPKEDEENFGEVLQSLKQKACEDISDIDLKKINGDIHRTGAKCLPDSAQDSKEPGTNYHLLGQVRIKPGRGDRTQSVSCSDKIARWIHIGVQGALLDLLINKPFFIHHFVFGAGVPYSEESLTRSLLKRTDVSMVIPDVMPKFYQSRLVFPHIKSDLNVRPAAGSIVWSKSRSVEVAVQGRKLGVTKKKLKLFNNSLCISKYNIYQRFENIINQNEELKKLINAEDVRSIPYNAMKRKSIRYLEKWELVKKVFFKAWTKKPDMWNFSVNDT
ncbi:adenosine deaminase, tRNA-specific 1 [Choristoneura fumiferana]|uniref:adenosine deaminase, tRNA-specific 1 n=1 Tax=Choristoneura fumiferana TaxID=7141 RepID=UPI003D1544CD